MCNGMMYVDILSHNQSGGGIYAVIITLYVRYMNIDYKVVWFHTTNGACVWYIITGSAAVFLNFRRLLQDFFLVVRYVKHTNETGGGWVVEEAGWLCNK